MEIVENVCMFSIFWSGARHIYSWVSYFDLVKYRQLFFSFQVGHHGQSGVLVVKVVAAANKNAIGNAIWWNNLHHRHLFQQQHCIVSKNSKKSPFLLNIKISLDIYEIAKTKENFFTVSKNKESIFAPKKRFISTKKFNFWTESDQMFRTEIILFFSRFRS